MGTIPREASTTERGRIKALQRLDDVLSESRRIRQQLELFVRDAQLENSTDGPDALTDVD
jgi:hypothetical protein